jgi:hypothetical protein
MIASSHPIWPRASSILPEARFRLCSEIFCLSPFRRLALAGPPNSAWRSSSENISRRKPRRTSHDRRRPRPLGSEAVAIPLGGNTNLFCMLAGTSAVAALIPPMPSGPGPGARKNDDPVRSRMTAQRQLGEALAPNTRRQDTGLPTGFLMSRSWRSHEYPHMVVLTAAEN